jgi:hypothetical protein
LVFVFAATLSLAQLREKGPGNMQLLPAMTQRLNASIAKMNLP